MKPGTTILVVLLACLGAGLGRCDTTVPTHYLDRYAHIWESKPFVMAAAPVGAEGKPGERYAITGYAQLGASDVLFLLDRTTLLRFTITQSRPENGVELVAITSKDDASTLKARIRANGQETDLSYDAGVAAAAAPAQASGQPDNIAAASAGNPPPDVAPPQSGNPALVKPPQPAKVIRRKSIQTQ